MRKKSIVTVWCYGEPEIMPRKVAIKKYTDCANYSEGSERERYLNILFMLNQGENTCYDNIDSLVDLNKIDLALIERA